MKLKDLNRERKIIVLVVFVCIVFIVLMKASLSSESGDYDTSTESILNGTPFMVLKNDGSRVFYDKYPPVFPIILAFFTWISNQLNINRLWLIIPFSIFCFSYSAVLLSRVFDKLKIKTGIWIAILFGVLNPFMLWMLLQPLSEPFYFLTLILALSEFVNLITEKNSNSNTALIKIGFWLGLGWLTRPISIFVPFLFSIFILVNYLHTSFSLAIRKPLITLTVSVLVVIPWQFMSFRNTNQFNFLSSNGVAALRDGLSYNHKTWREPFEFDNDVQDLLNRFQSNYDTYIETKLIKTFLIEEWQKNKKAVMKLYTFKALRGWYGTDAHKTKIERGIIVFSLSYILILIPSLIFVARKRRDQRDLFIVTFLSILIILSISAINAVSSSLFRYILPFMILGYLPITAFLSSIISTLKLKIHL